MSPGVAEAKATNCAPAWYVVSAIWGRHPAQLLSRSFRILKIMFFGMARFTNSSPALGPGLGCLIQSSFSWIQVTQHRDFPRPHQDPDGLTVAPGPVIDGVLDSDEGWAFAAGHSELLECALRRGAR